MIAIQLHAQLPADPIARHLRGLPLRRRCGHPHRLVRPALGRPSMEVMKQLRQRAIRDLVEQRPIRTQQELAAALRERGFRTTQATISRDVAELGLIKVTREAMAAYAIPPRLIEAETSGEDRLRKLLGDLADRGPRGGAAARRPDAARARPTRSRPRSTGRAGPRSPARSPATTPCSWRSRTVARCSASSAACCGSPRPASV